jgi:homocysteine S-methyltransferase
LYEAARVRDFLAAAREYGIKIFIGIMPVLSSRTAEYLHHEVPGISIPQSLRDAMKKKDDAEYQMQTGMDHVRGLIAEIVPVVDGLYIIAPHTRPEVAAELVAFAKKQVAA